MVKIQNVFGDIKKGKQDNAIYQLHYGRQIRRVAYKEKIQPSLRQINQRIRFKDAVLWVNSLTSPEKTNLKKYYSKSYQSWKPGQPSTWYNWAKTFIMKKPELNLSASSPYTYFINHPAILKIEELDDSGGVVYTSNNLSNITAMVFKDHFSKDPNTDTVSLRVTTLPGIVFEYDLDVPQPIIISFPC